MGKLWVRNIYGGMNFNSAEKESLEKLKLDLRAQNIRFPLFEFYRKNPGFTLDEIFVRFIVAEEFNISKTIARLKTHHSLLESFQKKEISLNGNSIKYLVHFLV